MCQLNHSSYHSCLQWRLYLAGMQLVADLDGDWLIVEHQWALAHKVGVGHKRLEPGFDHGEVTWVFLSLSFLRQR